ncbi:hypothetical protein CY34DRAFT_811013 [Suillus luteus UH-Slu-Lm8-n1]|uniref:Uncharacterized protein n=1 Tax=Suillus luteus UH-Slu-Lm8-n1 TaxID=930992 RepID=A0A0D0AR36_9AGAM|nr:hypothetical protein CY34DRAFT_811013 [Suillus luteus UH-Slu-Lm8-n1]
MHKDIVCSRVTGWRTNQDTEYTYETLMSNPPHPQPNHFLIPAPIPFPGPIPISFRQA